MNRLYSALQNEDGVATLVVSVTLLVLLTIVGTSTIKTANVEQQVATNERIYRQNFYRAEAGAVECAQNIENQNSRPDEGDFSWLNNDPNLDLEDTSQWDTDGGSDDTAAESTIMADTSYAAEFGGIAGGSSMLMTNPSHLFAYDLHGLYQAGRDKAHIVMGYRKRF